MNQPVKLKIHAIFVANDLLKGVDELALSLKQLT